MLMIEGLAKNSLSRRGEKINQTDLFLAEWYVKNYAYDIVPGQNPLQHYILTGNSKGFWPNPYFDPVYYREKAKVTPKYKRTLLEHYIKRGWKKGLSPSRLFDAGLYCREYPDAAKAGMAPLAYHYRIGRFRGYTAFHTKLKRKILSNGLPSSQLIADMKAIAASGLFDEDWYINQYADLRNKYGEGLLHYIQHGTRERRMPNPVFDTHWYRQAYLPSDSTENPLVNYLREGVAESRQPGPDFISKEYRDPDFLKSKDKNKDPLKHFLLHGYKQGKGWPRAGKTASVPGKTSKLPVPELLRTLTRFEPVALAPAEKVFSKNCLNLHWIVPDFAAGGGGHMTIFRMISFMERFGHKQTVWISNPGEKRTDQNGFEDIQKYFQFFSGEVKILDDRFSEASGDAIIATDCWTVWPALSAEKFIRRFYFVQDYEPSFHAVGSLSIAAEQTYRQDLDCICASPWLSGLMKEKYGRWAQHFWLAADTNLYHPPKNRPQNSTLRIAFYARHFTERRAVELGFLALEELANQGVSFEVDFFGADLGAVIAPFKFIDHGVATPDELAAIFQKADIGVVFSATNYSLVPQEMMACGLPIVELRGESTECIFPEECVTLADPMPRTIAEALKSLLDDPAKRQTQQEAALKWVQGFSWKKSAEIVEASLLTRLEDFAEARTAPPAQHEGIKASVVIPTYNAGAQFADILEATTAQLAPWPFEILVVDSGSTDETLDIVKRFPSIRLHQIEPGTFNHGDTRNLGVELTGGDFIAFLTHDALPADNRWLYKLVTSLERQPNAAGVFGKHLPYDAASPFTKRDLEQHFENFNTHPLVLHRDTNKIKYANGDKQWRQLLHFYSDNNSCMRRSVWEKIPYRPVKFGEDQVWANDVIEAGYAKLYSPRARVYHSHDFTPAETFDRCKTEAAFFKHFFGYRLVENQEALEKSLKGLNAADTEWAKAHGIDDSILEARLKDNEARLAGYLAGAKADTSDMF